MEYCECMKTWEAVNICESVEQRSTCGVLLSSVMSVEFRDNDQNWDVREL